VHDTILQMWEIERRLLEGTRLVPFRRTKDHALQATREAMLSTLDFHMGPI